MKKLFLLIFIVLLFISCDFIVEPQYGMWNFDYDFGMFTFEKGNVSKVGFWIFENIKYAYDANYDNWQTAQETLDRGKGDCEDQAILMMAIIHKYWDDYKCNFVELSTGFISHAVIRYKGKLYDNNGLRVNGTVKSEIEFDEVPYKMRRSIK